VRPSVGVLTRDGPNRTFVNRTPLGLQHPTEFVCELCGEQKNWTGNAGNSLRGGNHWLCGPCRHSLLRGMDEINQKILINSSFLYDTNIEDVAELLIRFERYRKYRMVAENKGKLPLPFKQILKSSGNFEVFKQRILDFMAQNPVGGAAAPAIQPAAAPEDEDEDDEDMSGGGGMDPNALRQHQLDLMSRAREAEREPIDKALEKYANQNASETQIENLLAEYIDSYSRPGRPGSGRYNFNEWNNIIDDNESFVEFRKAIKEFVSIHRRTARSSGFGYGKGQAVIDEAAEKFDRPRAEVFALYTHYVSNSDLHNAYLHWSDAIHNHDNWEDFVEDIKNFATATTLLSLPSMDHPMTGAPSFEFSALRL